MEIGQIILAFIMGMVGKYPVVASILVVIGTLRVLFKSIRIAAESFVAETPTKKDDAKLEEIKISKVYIFIAKFFDLFASIKLPGAEK